MKYEHHKWGDGQHSELFPRVYAPDDFATKLKMVDYTKSQ